MKKKKPEVSVIFVNYNSADLLENAIKTLKKFHPALSTEIIVVDNASSEKNGLSRIKKISEKTIFLKKNRGYAFAVNRGIERATGKFIVIANPDLVFFENTLQKMVDFMKKRPEAGTVVPQYLNPDRTIQTSTRKFHRPQYLLFSRNSPLTMFFPKNPFSRSFLGFEDFKKPGEAVEIEVGIAAFLLTKREVIEKVGKFDERYFMFSEDSDFCFRVKKAGFKNFLLKSAQVIHIKGATRKKQSLKSNYWKIKSALLFMKKFRLIKGPLKWLLEIFFVAAVAFYSFLDFSGVRLI